MTECGQCGGGGVVGSSLPCPSCTPGSTPGTTTPGTTTPAPATPTNAYGPSAVPAGSGTSSDAATDIGGEVSATAHSPAANFPSQPGANPFGPAAPTSPASPSPAPGSPTPESPSPSSSPSGIGDGWTGADPTGGSRFANTPAGTGQPGPAGVPAGTGPSSPGTPAPGATRAAHGGFSTPEANTPANTGAAPAAGAAQDDDAEPPSAHPAHHTHPHALPRPDVDSEEASAALDLASSLAGGGSDIGTLMDGIELAGELGEHPGNENSPGRSRRDRARDAGVAAPSTGHQLREQQRRAQADRSAAAKARAAAQRAAARAKATIAAAGTTALTIIIVLAVGLGGTAGMMAYSTLTVRNAELAPPKPTDAQCFTVGGAGWCEVFWGAQQAASADGSEPVPFSVLAAVAHYATDNGRRSPSDSVDRAPTAGVGSDTLATAGEHAVVTYTGDAAAAAFAPAIRKHYMTLDLTETMAPGAADINAALASTWTSTFIPRPNAVVLTRSGQSDAAAVTAAALSAAARMPASTIFWVTLPGDENLNKGVAAAAAAEPRIKIVDVAAKLGAEAHYLDPAAADGMSPAGRLRAAQLVADDVTANHKKATGGTPAMNNRARPLAKTSVVTAYGAPGGIDVCGTGNSGTDYAAAVGDTVFAPAPGTVEKVYSADRYGTTIVLKSAGARVRLSHLGAVAVKEGQQVAAGRPIALAGATGTADGTPVLHVELMRVSGGYDQADCAAFIDPEFVPNPNSDATATPAAAPSGSPTPAPSGAASSPAAAPSGGATPAPSGTASSPAATPSASAPGARLLQGPKTLPERPAWIGEVGTLNTPAGADRCPVPTITPGISGPRGSSGPFLLNAEESEKMRSAGQDPDNPCQSAVWLARALAHSQEVKDVVGDNAQRFRDGQNAYTKFWSEAIAAAGLTVDPRAPDTDCTTFPAGATVADKIEYALACRSSATTHTVTGYTGTTPDVVSGKASFDILREEAVKVAGVFSNWGTAGCDAAARYSGVFPLTTDQMAATDLGGGRKGDRCNPDDNISAAAIILLKGEAVAVADRGTARGPYTALLGGWATFGPVADTGTADTLAKGPLAATQPDMACAQAVDAWLGSPNPTKDNAPLGRDGCTGEPSIFYPFAATSIDKAITAAGTAGTATPALAPAQGKPGVAELTALKASLPPATPPLDATPAMLARLSRSGAGAPVQDPANPQGKTSGKAANAAAGSGGELAGKVAAFAVAVGGFPLQGRWQPPTCDGLGAAGAAGAVGAVSINLPAGDAETNARSIFSALVAKGASEAGAAGILGNISQESGFDPNIFQGQAPFAQKNPGPPVVGTQTSGSEGFGLVQWTSHNRQQFFLDQVAAKGGKWDDLGLQVEILVTEMQQPAYVEAWNIAKTTTSPSTSAFEFHRIYEGSADTPAMIAERTADAEGLYTKFKGGAAGATAAVPAINTTPSTAAPAAPAATGASGRVMPVPAGTPVTSGYGMRGTEMHDGTDFGVPIGAEVYAAHDGTVRNRLDDPTGYGKYVQITGADGTVTDYGHVSELFLVPDGTSVRAGTLIAKSGNEGSSQGPHLHFRVRTPTGSVDPEQWLQGAGAAAPGGTPGSGGAASVPRPNIVDKTMRNATSAQYKTDITAYSQKHYGTATSELKAQAVTLHYTTTGAGSWQSVVDTWDVETASGSNTNGESPQPAAHFIIEQDGTIYQTMPLNLMVRHTIGMNDKSIGIEFIEESSGTNVLNRAAQVKAGQELVRWLMAQNSIPKSNIVGHGTANSSPLFHDQTGIKNDHTDWNADEVAKFVSGIADIPTGTGKVEGTCVQAGAASAGNSGAAAASCPAGPPGDLCRIASAAAPTEAAAKAIAWGFNQLGAPYSQPGRMSDNPKMFDCSSFVARSWSTGGGVTEFFGGQWAPNTATYAAHPAWLTEVTREQAKPGDIIISWNQGQDLAASAGSAGHAQMYLGDGKIIESGGRGDDVSAGDWFVPSNWQYKIFHPNPPAAGAAA